MLKNYFQVAIRQLRRQPAYTALNVLGLTIGTVSCLIIVLYLSQELNYDNYHDNVDNIYRITSRYVSQDEDYDWAVTQVPLGQTIKKELSEISQYARFLPVNRVKFTKNNINYFIDQVYFVDSTALELFKFEFILGDPYEALTHPNSLVLSESEAQKIFKGENPIGQILTTKYFSFIVRGVYKDQQSNSHLITNAMASLNTSQKMVNINWDFFDLYTYVVLEDLASPDSVVAKLNGQIYDKYVAASFNQFDAKIIYDLINIQDIHLKSQSEVEPTPLGNQDSIYIFSAVAVFMVLIACINYMNLATAHSVRRSLEIGVRKVMGANRNSLISQFLVESVIVVFISLVLSLGILLIVVPLINNQLNTNLNLHLLITPEIILTVLGLFLFTAILSGAYPAFYLSAYSPVNAIRGSTSIRSGKVWVRQILVGLQFSVSIFMLISTFVIYDQMQYARNSELGFDKEQVITFNMSRELRPKWKLIRNRLMQNPEILKAGTSSVVPGREYWMDIMSVEQNDGTMDDNGVNFIRVDCDYFTTLDLKIVEGRNFSHDFITDTAASVVVNESLVKHFAWEEPLGKKIIFKNSPRRVVGVVKDFHHLSLHNPIDPLIFVANFNNRSSLIKIGGAIPESLEYIDNIWNEFSPNIPLDYSFLDEGFLEAYEADQLRGRLFLGFAVIMIFITTLGLLGLASYIASQRKKELSIRKVLGAKNAGLITLQVRNYILLVLIGAIPAFVIGHKVMDNWLQSFVYHVNVNLILLK